jgi:selenoprotein W-related protein
LADEIKANVDGADDVTLTESSGGVFEITVDGKLVYSKKETGQFPEHAKALELISGAA